MRSAPPKGEMHCASVESVGRGRTCIRDAKGTRESGLIIRSDIGDKHLIEMIRSRVAPIEGVDSHPSPPVIGLTPEEAEAARARAQTQALGPGGGLGASPKPGQATQRALQASVTQAAAAAAEAGAATASRPQPRKSMVAAPARSGGAAGLPMETTRAEEEGAAAAQVLPAVTVVV